MCSLTNEMRVFRPKDHSTAVVHRSEFGPSFRNAIAVAFKMNGTICGWSPTEGSENDEAQYYVPADSEGNSVLTGGNPAMLALGIASTFICTGLEVFLLD